ncbi:HNH endonuclease [Cryobacterium sp. M15]|uniref:HNH endonuclease n=1 Tax=Cryobacterium sp. M15 TaxID=2048291 RepID=UPI001304EF4F|nr:HNH endonuclease [Cryobacterium sp. M15]
MADSFAGPLIRHVGIVVAQDPAAWQSIIHDGEVSYGIRTNIYVNGSELDMSAPMDFETWQSLEIECTARIPRVRADPDDKVISAGSQCLALIIECLEFEALQDIGAVGLPEGAVSTIEVNRYERSPVNRLMCLRHYGYTCWVCDLDFAVTYGDIGLDFVEVHHRVPVSQITPGYLIDPLRDLIPLCSNCHSMVHRRNPPYSPEELRLMIGRVTPKSILNR